MDNLISVADDIVLLEITPRCYCKCDYCYKGSDVGLRMPHVSLDRLESRLEWVKEHTDAKNIALIGGEPLTYPDLKELTDYIQHLDFGMEIVTSGNSGRKYAKNVDLILDLYGRGDIVVQLSYHPGRNEKHFESMFKSLNAVAKESYSQFRKEMTDIGKRINSIEDYVIFKDLEKRIDRLNLVTTVTISPEMVRSNDDFMKMLARIFQIVGLDFDNGQIIFSGARIGLKDIFKEMDSDIQEHFRPFRQSKIFNYQVNFSYNSFGFDKYVLRFVGAMLTEPSKLYFENGEEVSKFICAAKGHETFENICPAMESSYHDDRIVLSSALIRTDGELTFSPTTCIVSKKGLGNIDDLLEPEDIFNSFSKSLDWKQKTIMQSKARRAKNAKGLCKADPDFPEEFKDRSRYVCPSCEFDIACNVCAAIDPKEMPEKTGDMDSAVRNWIDIVSRSYCL